MILDWLLGRPLADREEHAQRIGPTAGIPVLGLDALSSAAYGPEAALTVLLPLGAVGAAWALPIVALVVAILLVVFVSYRQTIGAYPNGGGSYTVARENLGPRPALLAGAALALDYVLNVAVGISAGIGALVSAVPALLPHTLALCLGTLVVLTLVNLRGTRESGLAFLLPTWAFVGTMGSVIAVGLVKTLASGGHPVPVAAPPALPAAVGVAGAWVLLRAFASGCTAMTGVEAVSNAVPLFRAPSVRNAERTLAMIIAILVALLLGIGTLARVYGVGATDPGAPGYQSVLSSLTAAVVGRGAIYYVTMGAVVAVLALSANTSFADFPRLCRVLAEDRYLPGAFAERGRRLVFSRGIITLAVLAGALLIVFGGITDRLIPLFAIGAFLAFTLSQTGMVVHWRKTGGPRARGAAAVNAVGAAATGATLIVVAVSKFAEGAWIVVAVVPLLVFFFVRVKRHYAWIAGQIATLAPLQLPRAAPPLVVLAAGSWNRMTQHALAFAMRLSPDVHVVQIKTEAGDIETLHDNWHTLVEKPAEDAHIPPPKLVILTSEFRQFFSPFVDYVLGLERNNPDRDVVVVIPDLVMTHWYAGILHNNRGMFLRTLLSLRCGNRVSIVNTQWRLHDGHAS